MKFHLLTKEIKHTSYGWPIAACGKPINLISQFGYPLDQFLNHYAGEYRCKSCTKLAEGRGE